MLKPGILPILLISSNADIGAAFHTPPSATATAHHQNIHTWSRNQQNVILQASNNEDESTTKEKKGDNPAMAFLRKKGRIGGAANMDFANAMGLDESPSGGTKSSYHEDGFKVSVLLCEVLNCTVQACSRCTLLGIL